MATVRDTLRAETERQARAGCFSMGVIVSQVLTIREDGGHFHASRYDNGRLARGEWALADLPGDMEVADVLTDPSLTWHENMMVEELLERQGVPACRECGMRTWHHWVKCHHRPVSRAELDAFGDRYIARGCALPQAEARPAPRPTTTKTGQFMLFGGAM